MTETFYELLGVSTDATTEEIQRAYRQRIKETHPDVNDDPDASERTAELVEARDVLTDDDERARYDRLGHDTYVGNGTGGASDDADSAAAGADGPGAGGPGTGGVGDPTESARSTNSSDGPTNARAGPEERRRRERRARQHVDFGSATTASGPGAATAGGPGGAGGADVGATNSAQTEPPSWNEGEGWAARAPTEPPPGLATQVFEALVSAPATALVTFVLYPLLVFGAFLPAFPLIVNVVVGACLLAMIGASQSPPGLGVAVYGSWSALGTLGLLLFAVNPFSPLGVIVLGTTWLPLGFSLLTYLVLDA